MKWKTLDRFPARYAGGLAGYIKITHKELVVKFGKSLGPTSDGKIREQWAVEFEDGTIAVIYDWKRSDPIKRITTWNIGGSQKALIYVHAIFGQTHEGIKKIFGERE